MVISSSCLQDDIVLVYNGVVVKLLLYALPNLDCLLELLLRKFLDVFVDLGWRQLQILSEGLQNSVYLLLQKKLVAVEPLLVLNTLP